MDLKIKYTVEGNMIKTSNVYYVYILLTILLDNLQFYDRKFKWPKSKWFTSLYISDKIFCYSARIFFLLTK